MRQRNTLRRSVRCYIVAVGLAALVTGACWNTAAAATLLNYNGAMQGGARADGPYTVGHIFDTEAADVFITHLGVQDADSPVDGQDPDGADGLTGYADDDGLFIDTYGGGSGIQVGLWNADGSTELASVQVTSSDPVIGSWRYAPIPGGPITLQANTRYLIGAFVGGGREWFIDGETGFANQPFSANTGFTLVGTRYLSGSFGAPTSNGGGAVGRWGAANATAIPEPATFAALGLALVGIRRYVKRRKA